MKFEDDRELRTIWKKAVVRSFMIPRGLLFLYSREGTMKMQSVACLRENRVK